MKTGTFKHREHLQQGFLQLVVWFGLLQILGTLIRVQDKFTLNLQKRLKLEFFIQVAPIHGTV